MLRLLPPLILLGGTFASPRSGEGDSALRGLRVAHGTDSGRPAGRLLNPQPSGSPCRYLSFERRLGNHADLWVKDLLTGRVRRVRSHARGPGDDSGKSLFAREGEDDGGLDTVEEQLAWRPGPSPAGHREFLFVGSGVEENYDIYLGSTESTETIRLTEHTSSDIQPRWDAAGKSAVFVSGRNGNADLFLLSSIPSWSDLLADPALRPAPTRLTSTEEDDLWPAWSPDGRYIAFTSQEIGRFEGGLRENEGISLIDIEQPDRGLVRVTTDHLRAEFAPSWSPDGALIAYYVHDDNAYPTVGADEVKNVYVAVSVLQYCGQSDCVVGGMKLQGVSRDLAGPIPYPNRQGPAWFASSEPTILAVEESADGPHRLSAISVWKWVHSGRNQATVIEECLPLKSGEHLAEDGRVFFAGAISTDWAVWEGRPADSLYREAASGRRIARMSVPCGGCIEPSTEPPPEEPKRRRPIVPAAIGFVAGVLLALLL